MGTRALAGALIGRADELSALDTWLRNVGAGHAGMALIEGDAGLGKSRLADAAMRTAAAGSFTVVSGRADELDGGRPFGVLTDALGFAPVVPEGSLPVPGLEYRLVDQVVDRVERLAIDGPVVLRIEDLQWVDGATLVSLRALARRLAHLPLALLCTFRPWPRSIELERLVVDWQSVGALHLVLSGLTSGDVIALASQLLGAPIGSTLERQLVKVAGSPLFVHELLGALLDEGSIDLGSGRAELTQNLLPPSLQLTILRRVGLLGDETLALLRVASVLGTTFSLSDLATVTERPIAAVLGVLLEARSAGFVEEAGAMLKFRHDLVREALYSDLPESARRALHRDAGRALAAAGAPTLQVAEQLALGSSPGDGEAVRWLRNAARECVLGAPQTAASLLERAVALTRKTDAGRDQLLADLADALIWSGRPGEGQAIAVDLLARGIGGLAAEQARASVVRGLWLEGRWRELLAQTDRWLADERLPLGSHARGRILADQAMAAAFSGDVERAERLGYEALALGERIADDGVIYQALNALGPVHNFRGRRDDELVAAQRALALVQRGDNPDLVRFHPYFAAGLALLAHGRHEEAESAFATGLRLREALGTTWDLPLYQAGLAELHCQVGRWEEALTEAETGVEIATEVGTRLAVVVCAGIAAWIRVRRDELPQAERLLAIAQAEIDRAGPQWGSYWVTLGSAALADARGDRSEALRLLRDAWDASEGSAGLRIHLAPRLVAVAVAAGQFDVAETVAATVAAHEFAAKLPNLRGNLLLARGLAAGDAELLSDAAAAFGVGDCPYDQALAYEAAAATISAGGAATAAKPLFEASLQTYERLGARRDSGRALAAMRGAGLRRGSRASHRQELSGWEALTAMELDVVRLTIEGLTNREIGERLFISRRTVQTHLSHALTKLEVTSRVELAALAAKRLS